MKRTIYSILTIIICIILIQPVWANIYPTNSHSIKYYGIGVINMPDNFTIYSQPDKNSEILKYVEFPNETNTSIINPENETNLRKTLIAYIPTKNIAFITVETNEENGWYEVYADQENGEKGWVYSTNTDIFMTWKNLFYSNGKMNGLKFFNDITETQKQIFAQDDSTSQVIDRIQYPKFMNFTIIRGNWILLSVLDITSKNAKIGWVKWRNDDGSLNMFPLP